jgi:hypothetical protein
LTSRSLSTDATNHKKDRLSSAELLVDPEYASILDEEGAALVDEVQRECAYV